MTKLTELYEETLNESGANPPLQHRVLRNNTPLRRELLETFNELATEKMETLKFWEMLEDDDYVDFLEDAYRKGVRDGENNERIDNDHRDRPGMSGHGEPHRS